MLVFVSCRLLRWRDFIAVAGRNYRSPASGARSCLEKAGCAQTLSVITRCSRVTRHPSTNILPTPHDRRAAEPRMQLTPCRAPLAVPPRRQPPAVGMPRQIHRQIHQVLNHVPQPPTENLLPQRRPLLKRQPALLLQRPLAAQAEDVVRQQPQRERRRIGVRSRWRAQTPDVNRRFKCRHSSAH